MSTSFFHLRLPRRVTAYFLLFGLTAVIWLSAGAFYVAQAVNQSRSESAELALAGTGLVAAGARVPAARRQAISQSLVHDLKAQSGAAYMCRAVQDRRLPGPFESSSTSASRRPNTKATANNGATRSASNTSLRNGDCHRRISHADRRRRTVSSARWSTASPSLACGPTFAAPPSMHRWRFSGPACCMVIGAVLLESHGAAGRRHRTAALARGDEPVGRRLRAAARAEHRRRGDGLESRRQGTRHAGGHTSDLGQQIQQSLQKGRQGRLDGVLNSIPDGVATTDAAGRLTYTNLPMAAILGMKDIVGATEATSDAGAVAQDDRPAWSRIGSCPRATHCSRPTTKIGRSSPSSPASKRASAASSAWPAIRSASSAACTTNATSGSSATSRSRSWPRRCAIRSSTPRRTSCGRRWPTSRPTPRRWRSPT